MNRAKLFFEEELSGEPLHQDVIVEALEMFSLQERISELKKHIEHPTKPGYKRRDILNRIKELENGIEN